MEIMMNEKTKSNSVTTVTYLDGKLVFGFQGQAAFTFDPDRVSAVNRARAMMHGFEQRIRDGGALGRDAETGASATAEEKRAAMLRIAEHLMAGGDEWVLRVAAPKKDDPGLLAEAMMRALGKDAAGIKALIASTMAKRGIDETSALKIWQDTKQVIAAKAEIVAERAAAKAAASKGQSVEDLLAEIEGGGPAEPAEQAPF
jgi:hypothetical protein